MKKWISHIVGPLIGLALLFVAVWVLRGEMRSYNIKDVTDAARNLSEWRILAAFLVTCLAYALMTSYDALALYYIKVRLPFRKMVFVSFLSYAFSNSTGFGGVAGASVRFKQYSAWGLSPGKIAKAVIFNAVTLWSGLITLGGAIFALWPVSVPSSVRFPFSSSLPVGILFLLVTAIYLASGAFYKKPLQFRGRKFELPTVPVILLQILVSSVDWILAGLVLYLLLPMNPPFPGFIVAFLFAQTAGLISQLPGGLGVFETLMIFFVALYIPVYSMLGSLLLFRIIYYLLPLTAAGVLMGIMELSDGKNAARAFFGALRSENTEEKNNNEVFFDERD